MMNRSVLLLSLLISTMMMTMVSSFAIIGGSKSVSFRHSLAGSVNLLGHSQRSSLNKLTILSLSEENPEQQKAVASTKITGDVYDDEVCLERLLCFEFPPLIRLCLAHVRDFCFFPSHVSFFRLTHHHKRKASRKRCANDCSERQRLAWIQNARKRMSCCISFLELPPW